jgi:predicted DNA-binding transcriptional regulator AlpA
MSRLVAARVYDAEMPPDVSTEDLVGAVEVAELLGLSHASSVSTYVKRYPDFPAPVVELPKSRVRLWLRQEILGWASRRAKEIS